MRLPNLFKRVALALVGVAIALPVAADPLAKEVFGSHRLPAATRASVYGTYSKGCFQGGLAIATDGPNWQSMRLSRNRRWGHPEMITLLERFSRDAVKDGWPGLLLGDVSQPRGGPMLSGHASHQLGLDADIWFLPMPNRRLSAAEREKMDFVSMLKPKSLQVDDRKWTPAHAALLKRAASYPNVERVLVHPGIKKKLCDTVTGDRSWLRKVRPIWGHDSHFHIRIGCPAGSPGCKRQEATAAGDGCDKSLAWWFTDEPWKTSDTVPVRARDVMRLSALPNACKAVLNAPAPVSEAAVTVGGRGPTMIAQTSATAAPITANAFAPTPDLSIPMPFPRPQN